jgi:hypothetical protein
MENIIPANSNRKDIIMADIAPPDSFIKIGSIAMILLVAFLAIYLNNNFTSISNLTAKKSS